MLEKIKLESPLIFYFIAISIGIVVGNYIAIPLIYSIFMSIAILLLLIVFGKNKYVNYFYYVLLILLGIVTHSRYNFVDSNNLQNFEFPSEKYHINGIVESKRIYPDKLRIVLKDVEIEGNHYTGKILTTLKNHNNGKIFKSDTIEYIGSIYSPDGARNPGEFNYQDYLKKRKIYLLSYADQKEPLIIKPNLKFSLNKISDIVKSKIMANIDMSVTGEPANVLKALIVGARDELDGKTSEIFVYSGTIHILAVSGLHVGYVTLSLLVIFTFLRFGDKWRTILTVIGLIFYIFIVDFKPSVVRAVIMASLILIGKSWERKVNVYNSLAAAGFIQLLISPNQLFDAGFQLSFMAVFSIVYFYRRLIKMLSIDFSGLHKYLKYFIQLFIVSLAALVGTLPITAFYFNRISPVGLLANLFAIPLISLIGAAGFAQVFLGAVIASVNLFYGQVNQLAIWLLIKLTGWSAAIPYGSIRVPSINLLHVFIFYLGIFALFNLDKRKVRFAFISGILFLLNVQIWWAIIHKPELEVVFFDVGQGDAALVKFPTGEKMLIDAADNTFSRNYAETVIEPYFVRENIHHIDVLALSHPHNDHIGGVPFLLQNISIGEIWEPEVVAQSRTYRQIHYLADSLNVPVKNICAGDYMSFGQCDLFVLHPSKKYLVTEPSGFNHYSTAIKLSYQDFDILFTGDIEKEDERYVSLFDDFIDCEILKVPHHGSNTSSSEIFIRKAKPDIAFVSVGRKNKFRHPSKEIINRYENNDVIVHRSDEKHALHISSDGFGYKLLSGF